MCSDRRKEYVYLRFVEDEHLRATFIWCFSFLCFVVNRSVAREGSDEAMAIADLSWRVEEHRRCLNGGCVEDDIAWKGRGDERKAKELMKLSAFN